MSAQSKPNEKPKSLTAYLYREIIFQGYAATRLTGLSASNVKRIIRNARFSKYGLSGIYGFVFALVMVGTLFGGPSSYQIFPLEAFLWVFLFVFVSGIQLSYGASAGPQIRDVLGTLPLSMREIQRFAVSALLKTMDLPLIVAFSILVIGGLLTGLGGLLAGVLAGVLALSLALLGIALLIRVFRRFSTISRIGSFLRMISVLPIVLISLLSGTVVRLKFDFSGGAEVFIPVINLGGVVSGNTYSLAVALCYTLMGAVFGYMAFRDTSVLLLSPYVPTGRVRGKFNIKLRGPITSIVVTDFRQVLRSPRLIGVFLVPIVFIMILVFDVVTGSGERSGLTFNLFYLQSVLPVAFVTSYIPYVLYFSELKAYAYFKILPISKYTNILSKVFVTLLFYLASASLMAYAVFRLIGSTNVIWPIYALFLPIVASVLVTSIYFYFSVKSMSLGITSLSTNIVYTVINAIVFAVPVVAYFAASFFGLHPFNALFYMVAASIIEITVLLVLVYEFVK
jgi:predicted permease